MLHYRFSVFQSWFSPADGAGKAFLDKTQDVDAESMHKV
jgi:hypothetical protein